MPKLINMLAIDGGGVRGFSPLIILEELMEKIDKTNPKEPFEYFDLIVGSSAGGIIAIMLGCLKIPLAKCIEIFPSLCHRIFAKGRGMWSFLAGGRTRFSTATLEAAVKDILVECGMDETTLLQNSSRTGCAVFVCAFSKETGETVRLRSYPSPCQELNSDLSNLFDDITILEACRATSAAPTYFRSMSIPRKNQKLMDGGLAANNPTEELWSEAQYLWSVEQLETQLGCLVSIGTGKAPQISFDTRACRLVQSIVALLTDAEKAAKRFLRSHKKLAENGQYVRFNVEVGLGGIGLAQHKEMEKIRTLTERYLEAPEVQEKISRWAALLETRRLESPPAHEG